MDREICVLRADEIGPSVSSGQMSRRAAISAQLAGSEGIFMGTARVPPGLRSSAHVHTNCESALYVVSGRGHFLAGARLERTLPLRAGDFIYVPPAAPHVVVNDGDDDLVLVVARNTQEEQVAEYDPDRGVAADAADAGPPPLDRPLLLLRCKTCRIPIRGPQAVFSRLRGIRPYKKNPQLCNRCESRIQGSEDWVVTSLFADIRGSTQISADRDALVLVLRRFFADATPPVYDNYGVVDRFLGDGLLAFFNVPVPRATHAEDALKSALDIQSRMAGAPFGVGIGIETGVARAGNMGLSDVCDFTCVGEPVSVASRLQGIARPGEIVIGPGAWPQLADLVELRGLELETEITELKGLGPIGIHRLFPRTG